jgi:NAD-dependent SIR2 family protein deacetylase
MTQNETIVFLSDLRFVEIHCSHCSTKVTLDMQEPSEFSKQHGFFAPKECPGCRKDFDTAIRPAVDAFQRAYRSLSEIPKSITFRGISGHV